jgi:diguanylate cyclase (GGDEF)-like protein
LRALPGSLLRAVGPSLAGALLVVALGTLAPTLAVAPFLRTYPALPCAATVALATVFRSSRAATAALAVGLATVVLRHLATPSPHAEELLAYGRNAVGVLLPLALASSVLWRERAVLSPGGLARLAFVAAQAGLGALAWLAVWPWPIAAVQAPLVVSLPHAVAGVGQPALAAFLLATAVVLTRLLQLRSPLEGAMLCSLGLSFLALTSAGEGELPAVFLAGAGAAQLVAVLQRAAASAVVDPLTGLPGRRAFDERLAELGGPFVVALVDIDHFKGVNDRFGHVVGDQVLRMVAARLREVGGGGVAYRYGGEEFAVIFTGATLATVQAPLEALRQAVAATPFRLRGSNRPKRKPERPRPATGEGRTVAVTVSIGAAQRHPGQPAVEAVEAADRALYRAKAAGRNTLVGAPHRL